MGQNESINTKGMHGLPGQWQPSKRGTVRHSLTAVQLFEQAGRRVAEVSLPVHCRNAQQAADYYRYYQARGKMQSQPSLIKLLHAELVDVRGESMGKYLQQAQPSSIKTRVDTMCTLSIFETNCRRFAVPERTDFKGELRLVVEHCSSNLEQQSERRRYKEDRYSEQELWDLLEEASAVANTLAQAGMKEPALSPLAIKVTPNGKYRIGEWEFAHFFEQADVQEEETNFHQEGETFLHQNQKVMEPSLDKYTREFDILTHYYWPPEGTTGVQSMMALGKLIPQDHNQNKNQGKGQIFSLAMTLLQLILQRPLYQRETFSEKKLIKFLQEAVSFRNNRGLTLSYRLVRLLGKMLAWDPQDRLDFQQLQLQLGQGSASLSSVDDELAVSNKLKTAMSYVFSREVDDSGRVKQGRGDEAHPVAEQVVAETNRSLIQDCSVNYHKLDYTIHRERREWERFESRLNESSYPLLPGIEIVKHSAHLFSAEVMLGDCEDQPNEEQLTHFPVNNETETEVFDEEDGGGPEQSRKSQDLRVQESIKLMNVSNRRATEQSSQTLKSGRRPLLEMANPPSINNNFSTVQQARKFTPKGAFSSQESLLLKSSKSPQIAHFKQNSVEQISVSHDEELFTSPQLMALIRSSVRRHERQNSDNVKLQLSPSCVRSGAEGELSKSSFVKEQFAKGWYEGGKNGGMRSGYGTFHYNQGGKYCGDWQDNQMHGRGTLYYADGRIAYQGDWRQDALHGQGILYNQNPKKLQELQLLDYSNLDRAQQFWIYYEGGFVNDDKEGQGALQLSNGERFQGEFRGDVVQGRGTFFALDGRVITGEWSNNHLVRVLNLYQNKAESNSHND